MKLKIACGTNSYELDLEGDGRPTTFGELKSRICDDINVDIEMLRIIHRGRTLSGDDADSIDKFNFKDGDKLLVMGKQRAALINDSTFHALVDFEKKTLVGWQTGYDDMAKDLVELEKKFLEPKNLEIMMDRLHKRMKVFNEIGSRHMLTLDGMEMSIPGATEAQVMRNREKRKELINGIDSLLNQNDALIRRLEELQKSCEGNK